MEYVSIQIDPQTFARIFSECLAGCLEYRIGGKWTTFYFSDGSKTMLSSVEIVIKDSKGNWIAYLYLA